MAGRTLQHSPGLLGLYAKAALGSVPLPGKRDNASGDGDLSDLWVRLDDIVIDADHLTRYRDVCGYSPSAHVPITYPHVLAFPLHLALMTDEQFPFPAIGAVHIFNTIRQHRPLSAAEPLTLDVRVADLRPHPRGRKVTLITTGLVDGSTVWDSETVVLHREPAASDHTTTAGGPDLPDDAPPGPQIWKLPSGLGRRYAAASGDRNPIHLFDLTALPLGFRHHIAHGMWSKARCVAELENRLPDAYTVTVGFKKPINLPGRVRFGARQHDDSLDFGLASPSSGAPHLLGRITAL